MTTFTNGRITLATDPIYGVVVLSTNGWVPFSDLDSPSIQKVRDLLDFNTTCPNAIFDAVYGLEVLEPLNEDLDAYLTVGGQDLEA